MNNDTRDQTITETHTMVVVMRDEIAILSKAINGKQGLMQEIATLKQVQVDCEKRRAREPAVNSNRLAFAAIGVGIFVAPVISLGTVLIAQRLGAM